MKRLLFLFVAVLLMFLTAYADTIIIGPPDDETVVDTTYDGTEEDSTSGSPPAPQFSPASTPAIDSVTISAMDCSGFPEICMYVDVIDEYGVPVAGMTADSFCVSQDGTPIGSFTVEQLSMDSCVTSVCLVVDLSGSMRDDDRIDSAKAAMHRFVDRMDPFDRVAIVSFASCVTTEIAFTSNQTDLHEAIDSLVADGYTAAFDGIYRGVELATTELGSKAVIAFTDGVENRSQSCWPPPDGVRSGWWGSDPYTDDSTLICDLANSAGIPVFTFNLGPIDDTWYNPEALQAFASGTGGFWAHAATGADIDSVYNLVKQRLCSRYYICYESLDTVANGDWHTSQVCYFDGTSCDPCDIDSCQELDAPEITLTISTIELSDTCQPVTDPIDICAYVTDLDTPGGDLTVQLFYRSVAGSYSSLSMTLTDVGSGDSTFCATVPDGDLSCKSWVDYYLTASDGQANVSEPAFNPQGSPHRIELCAINPPVADAGADQTIFQCTAAEICWPASCTDPDNNLLSCELYSGPTGATYDGTDICFTPTGTLDYEFVLKAVDSCGSEDYDTAVVYYTLNSPPEADAGNDSTLFLCGTQQVCWPAACTDVDGNLSTCLVTSGAGTYDGSDICFSATASGTYEFVLQATDSCGETGVDTISIDVTINSAPVCVPPADTAIFQCTPTLVSLPWDVSDIDGNLQVCQITSGQGSLVGNTAWQYTPSADQTVNVTIRCQDSCGAFCESQFTVDFDLNDDPTVAFGNDTTTFLCSSEEICLPYTASDPDTGQTTTVSLVSGSGTLNTGDETVCFTPTSAGTYSFVLEIEDACGATDRDTIEVTVGFNSPPVANAGTDQILFQCLPTEVCWPASCSDPDDNLATCELVSATGSYDGTDICFTPTGTGSYDFILKATDACGATDYDTVTVDVTLNSAPSVVAQEDTSLFLCQTQEICVSYTPSDPDGASGLMETMVSGYGSIDTTANTVCFTPGASGDYQIIIGVADPCGETARDTVTVSVAFGEVAQITCPSGAFPEFLCGPDSIIQALTVLPDSATVSVSNGIYADGAVRFFADTPGSYSITVIASVQCGADTCEMTFDVDHNAPPVADAGTYQNLFQCAPAEVCWPASCSDPDGNLAACELVSATGSYDGTNICFTPAGTGSYDFVLRATDACGATDYDTVTVDITINSAPSVVAQADTAVFLCDPAEICITYTPSDPDGLAGVTETMIAGYGTHDAANDRICFTPTADGEYQFIIGVTDPCSESDQDTVTVTVAFGEVAEITCPTGTFTEFLCGPDSIVQSLAISPDSATVTVSEGIYADGAVRFFAGTAGSYTITVIASVQCGADTCEMTFDVDHNAPPVADAGAYQDLFQCVPTEVCWAASCSDPDANLATCELVSSTGTYDGTNICFTPTGTGSYDFVLKATDACGATDYDTVTVDITINSAPTVVAQADAAVFQCEPEEICVTYTPADPDGLSGLTETMISGYGTHDAANDRICFTPTAAGDYLFVIGVTDACAESDQDTVVVTVTLGEMALITCPTETFTEFLCGPDSIIQALAISPDSATVYVSEGIYADGAVRFLAGSAGTYTITVIADVECSADTCELSFDVTHNSPPIASAGSDQSVFQCTATEICWAASCSDVDVNLATCELLGAVGTYNGTNICFTPTGTGSYDFVLKATDDCGAEDYDTVTVDVTLNSAPTVVAQADTSQFLCTPQEICVSYTPGDPDGLAGMTETMFSGYGAIDAPNDRICFTPTASGTYEFIVQVTDGCGLSDQDTVSVTITFGEVAQIDCPENAFDVFLCDPTEICQLIDIAPSTATISVSHGTYAAGELCFDADTAGTYVITVIADESCGSDTCEVTFNVEIGEEPQIACPGSQSRFICEAGTVCVPVGVVGAGAIVTVSPIGAYSGGNLCFPADSSGDYSLKIIATTDCGVDTCDVNVAVTINSNPIAVDPSTPVDTFMCDPAQVCYQFSASDTDGGTLGWSRLSGDGTVSASGQWCFNVTTSGSKSVTAVVTDSCSATDTITLTYNVDMNDAPVVTLPGDTGIFLCNGDSYCFDYVLSDADNNIALEELSGSGTIDTDNDEVCFTPSASGTHQFIVTAIDSCGAVGVDTLEITVDLGEAVSLTCPADTAVFLCGPASVCRPVTIPIDTVVTVSPIGSYDAGQVCFDADTAGHYVIQVQTYSDCGSASCDVVVDVVFNSNPVAVDPTTPVDTFMCDPDQVCYQFDATDIDGGTLIWTRLSGDGTVTADGLWCFDVTATGTKNVTALVTDSCGVSDTTNLTYNIDMNDAPVVSLPNDTSVFICDGDSHCFGYGVTDTDDNVASVLLVSGPGTLDVGQEEVCFTPVSSGTFEFVVEATDDCGAIDRDTINVTVDLGTPVILTCPSDTAAFFCGPTSICRPVGLSIPGSSVTVSPIGTFDAGQVCFDADTSGHYVLEVIAASACGADTCQFVVDVTLNSNPIAVDPQTPVDTFMCSSDQVCYQFDASDIDGGTLTWSRLSGDGSIGTDGEWCFDVTTTASKTVAAVVTDGCGASDTVYHTYNVTVNSTPLATLGNDYNVFVCEGDSHCFGYSFADTDNNVVLEELVGGSGSIDTGGDQVCFTPTSSGAHEFVIRVTDDCGAVDEDTLVITVDLGHAVTLTCPGDTAMFLCGPEEICRSVDIPIDTNVVVSPIGTYNAGTVCFTADTTGHYVIDVEARSDCGNASCQVIVDVTMNSNPVAVDPTMPIDTFICDPIDIQCQFEASDVDGGQLTWSRLDGDGTVTSDGLWNFTAGATGTYSVTVIVTDECGAADTTEHAWDVTLNSAPIIAFSKAVANVFVCGSQDICLSYVATDVDGNLMSEELLSGFGTIDPVTDEICFHADTVGLYTLIVRATDSCGASDTDTIEASIMFNRAPVANAGADQSLFQCNPTEVCWTAGCTDIDDNLIDCALTTAVGTYESDQICFTPDTAGTYTFILQAEDACGFVDADTVVITVELNSAPVCDLPGDTTFFQCVPTEVTLPIAATDVDDNFDHCAIVSGPGSIAGGNWTYTPATDETVTVVVSCIDDCDAACTDSFTVTFDLNAAPVISLGADTTLSFCGSGTVLVDVAVSDVDGHDVTVVVESAFGTYDPGTERVSINVTYGNDRNYELIVSATDSCGIVDVDTARIAIDFNEPPVVAAPPSFLAYLDQIGEVCFDVEITDDESNIVWNTITVEPVGSYDQGTSQVCFDADTSGVYCLVITARDVCDSVGADTVCIEVQIDECLHVQIEKVHDVLQGHIQPVAIYLTGTGTGKEIGGFDFLIAYDASALTPTNVLPGSILEDCGWEYFTYRFGPDGNCDNGCPSGLIHIVGVAETNNGAYHPGCYLTGKVGPLAVIEYLVSNDRTMECQYVPIRFFWMDCPDNTFSSKAGDTMWVARHIYDFELNSIEDFSYGFPGYFGTPWEPCMDGGGDGKPRPVRCVDFTNGGVDIICADSIDGRGDINLNGLSYEVSDAVMFTNYFIYGLGAFGTGMQVEGSIAASDVNADGISLSVADLVYLVRVIVGDRPEMPKVLPGNDFETRFAIRGGVLSIEKSSAGVGAIYMVIEGEAHPQLHEDITDMQLQSNFDGVDTRVLIHNSRASSWLAEGPVVDLRDSKRVKSIEVGSYDGYIMKAEIENLPDSYSLSQNYPNPFNPVTTIEFALPHKAEWNLVIYNILGQTVEEFGEVSDPGYHKVEWDAGRYSSGIYFYRLTVGGFSATRKMVLLK